MYPDMRVLTLKHFGETADADLEATLSPMTVKMILARDIRVQDRDVKETTILFLDSDPVVLNLNSLDLITLQNIIGAYGFFEE